VIEVNRESRLEQLGFSIEQRVTTCVATINPKEHNMTYTTIPASQNEAWGFWGTMDEHATAAWPLAMNAVSDATGQPLDSVRIFLDSRHGRHFADEVQNGLLRGQTLAEAINAATDQWMGWRIGRQTSKDYGIPRGLPYLAGFVIHCEIVESGTDETLAA
jgi:hypothetical protein